MYVWFRFVYNTQYTVHTLKHGLYFDRYDARTYIHSRYSTYCTYNTATTILFGGVFCYHTKLNKCQLSIHMCVYASSWVISNVCDIHPVFVYVCVYMKVAWILWNKMVCIYESTLRMRLSLCMRCRQCVNKMGTWQSNDE